MLKWLRGLLEGSESGVNVSATEAQALMQGGALLLDVRSKGERQASLIPESKHIPVEQLASELGQLPKSKVIVCQCASGHRSRIAARQLRAQGFDAHSLSGGITAWKNAGFPVRKG